MSSNCLCVFDNEIVADRDVQIRNVLLFLHDIAASICYALPLKYALCWHSCFSSQLIMMQLIFLGEIYSCIQLCLLKSVGNWKHEHLYLENMIARAHLVQSHWCTFNVDHFHDTILFFTTLAFIEQQSHKDARYISRFNAFASRKVRLRSCAFCTNTFICDYFSNS